MTFLQKFFDVFKTTRAALDGKNEKWKIRKIPRVDFSENLKNFILGHLAPKTHMIFFKQKPFLSLFQLDGTLASCKKSDFYKRFQRKALENRETDKYTTYKKSIS